MSNLEEPFDHTQRQISVDDQPAALEFYLPPFEGSSAPKPPPPQPSKLERWQSQGGILGTLATVALVLLKLGAPLLKVLPFLPKLLVTGGSILVSIWLEAALFGWPFAVGLVLLIFVHECGHAFAAHQKGIPVTGMLFIPFMGALVARKRRGKSVLEDAYIGIMGPVFGTLGGVVCLAVFFVTQERFWLALAQFNFLLNLFNLLPTVPLDGGWIVPVFSPKLLAGCVVLLFLVAPHNPVIWALGFLSLPRIITHWKGKPTDPYFQVTSRDRWRYGIAYLGLAAILAWSSFFFGRVLNPPRRPNVDLAIERPERSQIRNHERR